MKPKGQVAVLPLEGASPLARGSPPPLWRCHGRRGRSLAVRGSGPHHIELKGIGGGRRPKLWSGGRAERLLASRLSLVEQRAGSARPARRRLCWPDVAPATTKTAGARRRVLQGARRVLAVGGAGRLPGLGSSRSLGTAHAAETARNPGRCPRLQCCPRSHSRRMRGLARAGGPGSGPRARRLRSGPSRAPCSRFCRGGEFRNQSEGGGRGGIGDSLQHPKGARQARSVSPRRQAGRCERPF